MSGVRAGPRPARWAARSARSYTIRYTNVHPSGIRGARRAGARGRRRGTTFSGDGRTLASGGDKGRLRLWDVSDPARPALRAQRTVAEAELTSLAFTRDGHHLITGNGSGPGADGHPAQVRRREDGLVEGGGRAGTAAGAAEDYLDSWGGYDGMPQLAFSPDGRFLAGADREDGVRRLRATAEAAELAQIKPARSATPTAGRRTQHDDRVPPATLSAKETGWKYWETSS